MKTFLVENDIDPDRLLQVLKSYSLTLDEPDHFLHTIEWLEHMDKAETIKNFINILEDERPKELHESIRTPHVAEDESKQKPRDFDGDETIGTSDD